MSILVNGGEHREAVSKAAHRRSESNFTATYGHRAEINQHARSGGVREAGSSTSVSIGNQRARYGSGAASRPLQRAYTVKLRRRVSPKVAGAALVGAAATGAVAHHRKVSKSAAATIGREAKRFKQGAKQGLKLAAKGHTHTGQIGTGVAGKPTFSVRPGTATSRRLGVHAGVAAGNAPTLAAGAAVGAAAERHHVRKSAFGVDLGEVEKGLGYGNLSRKASTAAKDTIKLEFKKPKPGVTPTGPGSQRGSMSASAWESRTAAARRPS